MIARLDPNTSPRRSAGEGLTARPVSLGDLPGLSRGKMSLLLRALHDHYLNRVLRWLLDLPAPPSGLLLWFHLLRVSFARKTVSVGALTFRVK